MSNQIPGKNCAAHSLELFSFCWRDDFSCARGALARQVRQDTAQKDGGRSWGIVRAECQGQVTYRASTQPR